MGLDILTDKILITGSSGYVGYVLSRHFSENGVPVVGLDIHPNPAWKGNKNFEFTPCDVTHRDTLEAVFREHKPSHTIHLAYLMDPIHDEKREYEIDVTGSKNVLKITNDTDTVKQLILFSSASAYGAWPDNQLWIGEDTPLRPRDYRYGINKKIVEEYYNSFNKREDLNLVTLRMCTAIGPLYHKEGGVVSLLTNAPFLVKSAKKHCEVQFLHEDDLKSLMDLVVNDDEIEGTYNLAPDSYATVKDLAPNKKFLPIPHMLMRGIIWALWKLRLSPVMPGGITVSTYGIVVNPKKIKDRYMYQFKHKTLSGFEQTVAERKKRGTL